MMILLLCPRHNLLTQRSHSTLFDSPQPAAGGAQGAQSPSGPGAREFSERSGLSDRIIALPHYIRCYLLPRAASSFRCAVFAIPCPSVCHDFELCVLLCEIVAWRFPGPCISDLASEAIMDRCCLLHSRIAGRCSFLCYILLYFGYFEDVLRGRSAACGKSSCH